MVQHQVYTFLSPDALFQLLLDMVSDSTLSQDAQALQLSSIASACLLSLVIALGDTGKMLSAVAALLTATRYPEERNVKVNLSRISYHVVYISYKCIHIKGPQDILSTSVVCPSCPFRISCQ